MDEAQIKRWLGVADLPGTVRREAAGALADFPYPRSQRQEAEALMALLHAGVNPKTGIFVEEDPTALVMTLQDVGAWYRRMITRGADPRCHVRGRVTPGGWMLDLEPLPAGEK